MKNIKTTIITLASVFALTACFDSDNNDEPEVPEQPVDNAAVRIVHASPDAPNVNILSSGSVIAGLEDLAYETASGLAFFRTGPFNFEVEAILPGGETITVIELPATLENDKEYNVLAVGDTADISALLVVNDEDEVGSGNIRAQVVHGAPDAPTVDVYVTAPDTDLGSEQPLATLSFMDFTGQVEVPAATYQIRVAVAGTTTVVFDSGPLDLAAGSDLFITATENTGAGDAPINLLVADGSASFVLSDINTTAEIRAIHGIADAPAVDVFADLGEDELLLFDGAPFKGVTPYIDVMGGDYLIDVKADADNSIVAIDDAAISLASGVRYTALANNTLAMADLDLIVDDGRPLATAAQVRIFHASQATGPVDIYVTADGNIAGATPAFTAVPYDSGTLVETGYVQLNAGDYVVTVTPTGTMTAAIETPVLSLEAGKIYTAIAVDGDAPGAGPQLILADDF